MQEQDRIYIPPRVRRPLRLPPDYHNPDKLNSERMLGAVMWGIIMALAMGVVVWFVRSAH